MMSAFHKLTLWACAMALMGLLFAFTSCEVQEVEKWRVAEWSFLSDKDYAKEADTVMLDVEFVHAATGKKLVRPAFWDGANVFRVRFAPTETGIWKWHTLCPQDASLDGRRGRMACVAYKGNLELYRHGFVKVEAGKKYMTYADGTPFLYLGDTHWGMYSEEIDEPGPHAGQTGAISHFKYIVDKRAEQGFTVYQSEPLGARFDLTDGRVDDTDIEGFRLADRYYQHIADAGLVHANAEFFFVTAMNKRLLADGNAPLERLGRYWVARFGAYPVMWTLGQEVDNDYYHEKSFQQLYDYSNNPWVTLAEYMHKYDCYAHPLSGHQENTYCTTVTGAGTASGQHLSNGGRSAFASMEVAKRTGHNWWAAQYSPMLTATPSADVARDYWYSSRPAVNYEGRYCKLWTGHFGARAQGWISFLSGFFGYGYGAVDMWLYKSTYDVNSVSDDGKEKITPEDKATHWGDMVECESARQMGHLKAFLQSFDWWTMVPVFPNEKGFAASEENQAYVYARTPEVHVLYFYNESLATGTLTGLPAGTTLSLTWMNPRTGEFAAPMPYTVSGDGTIDLPEKQDSLDWAMLLR